MSLPLLELWQRASMHLRDLFFNLFHRLTDEQSLFFLTNQLKALKESLIYELEQFSRRDGLEIRGIPKNASGMREDTNKIVVELGRKIGIDLKKEDISTSYRLPSKVKANGERALFPPAIIVKFTSRDVREKLYRARKVLKQDLGFSRENRICINESLTQSNKDQHEGSKVIQITNAKALRKTGEEMSYAQVIIPP